MIRRNKALAIFCSLSLLVQFFVCPTNALDRKEMWTGEIGIVQDQLPKLHKNLFSNITKEQWNNRLDKLKENIDQLTDSQVRVEMMKTIASVGDGHTSTYTTAISFFPFYFVWLKDGIFCEAATSSQKEAFCNKLVAIGGIGIDKAIEMVTECVSHDNEYGLQDSLTYWLTDVDVLTGLGIIKDTNNAIYTFEDKTGKRIDVSARAYSSWGLVSWDKDDKYEDIIRTNPPIFRSNARYNYWVDYFPQYSLVYIQYNRCRSYTDYSFSEFINDIKEFFDEKTPSKLVIDMRQNGGGSSSVMAPLLDWVTTSYVNKPDKLFVVTGKGTFSSAVINSVQLKQSTEATFVGEPTGGKPNHFGEVNYFSLEKAKMNVFYSTKFFKIYYDNKVDALYPDDIIETTSEQYFSGIDPIMDAIVNGTVKIPVKKKPPKPVLSREKRWEKDIDEAIKLLSGEASYINLNVSEIEKKLNILKTKIPSLSDSTILLEIQSLIASSGQPTLKVDLSSLSSLPVRFISLPDGIFVYSAIDKYKNLLGKKLTAIGGVNVDVSIMMKLRTLIPADNFSSMASNFADYAIFPDILKHLEIIKESKTVDMSFEDKDGCIEDVSMKLENYDQKDLLVVPPYDKPETSPLYCKKTSNYWSEFIPENNTLYVRFKKTEQDSYLFSVFAADFQSKYLSNNTRKIVLDLRGNRGGETALAEDFIRDVVVKANSARVPVFVLIDRYTQGSAVYDACMLRNLCKAVIVGENAGSKANHCGNPKTVTMEYESLTVQIPTQSYNFEQNVNLNTFSPSIPIDLRSSDYFQGSDPVLDWVLKTKKELF